MKFEEALAAMREGRQCIGPDSYTFRIKENRLEYFSLSNDAWVLNKNDLDELMLDFDWEIYEEPKKPLDFYEALELCSDNSECLRPYLGSVRKMQFIDGSLRFRENGKFASDVVRKEDLDNYWYEV